MSALWKMKIGVTAAGTACLLAGYVAAQQATTQVQQRESAEARQSDRAESQQSERLQSDRGTPRIAQRQTQAGQLGERRDQAVEEFLHGCLVAKNQAEIQMGQFAQQQAQNPQVKQFAQELVQDHQQLVQQLQQVAGKQRAAGRQEIGGQAASGQGTQAAGRQATGSGSNPVVNQLLEIDRQIVERQAQAKREELQQKSGMEFDKAFVGSQIDGHIEMLAALEVIEQNVDGELKQLVSQAQPKMQQHLEHAKQLKQQLESGQQTGASQAERQTPRTQR